MPANLGFTTRKNTPANAPPPSNRNRRTPAMIQGSFDFFFGAAVATAGAACGAGKGVDGVGGVGGVTGGVVTPGLGNAMVCSCEYAGGAGGGGCGVAGAALPNPAVFGGGPVGAVFLGRATVDANDESAIVAFGSGKSRLVAFSVIAAKSADVALIVAFGSKAGGAGGGGAINNPPSKVQNFCPSSGKVRLHFGQLFILTTSWKIQYDS